MHRRGQFRNPLIGRSLAHLATVAGLEVTAMWAQPIVHRTLQSAVSAGGPLGVAVDNAVADGALSRAEAAQYIESLETLDARGAFFFAAMSITVVARR
jgi:hypothetical protein